MPVVKSKTIWTLYLFKWLSPDLDLCSLIILLFLLQGDETSFGHTTISNLPANHSVLWVHIVLGIMFMPLGRSQSKITCPSVLTN